MNEFKEYILKNKITLVITSPNSRTLSIINLLNELSIKDKHKTTLFSFNISSNYYLQKLISFLSGINTSLISKYFYPCATINKHNMDKINRDKFLNSIEQIQNSNILMNDEKYNADKDYVDYILDYSKSNILIIDDLYALLDKTNYSLNEILLKVKDKKDKHLVLFVKAKDKQKMLSQYEEIISDYVLIDGRNNIDYKDITVNILNKTIKLRFNKMNQLIMEENDEGKLCNN